MKFNIGIRSRCVFQPFIEEANKTIDDIKSMKCIWENQRDENLIKKKKENITIMFICINVGGFVPKFPTNMLGCVLIYQRKNQLITCKLFTIALNHLLHACKL